MSYLLIENSGELDISSLVLLGASTKRGDNSKIGFFGSGNKYAISTLLRTGIPFKIYSGEQEVDITTEPVNFRGVEFKKIIINGVQTSLTTDMGPQWEPWMAIREWVSNSIDEGGYNIVSSIDSMSGREGYTRFFVEHNEATMEMIDNWNSYFTFEREDIVCQNMEGKLFTQTDIDNNLVLYRKGIRVFFDKGIKSLYQYDIASFEINESRLIDSLYTAEAATARFINGIGNVDVFKNILSTAFKDGTFEGRLPWRWAIRSLNPKWKEAIGKHALIVDNVAGYYSEIQQSMDHYIVSLEMAQQIKRSFPESKIYGLDDSGDVIAYKKVDPSPKESFLLKECLGFLTETQYPIEYDIDIVEFENSFVRGLAHDNKILISRKSFDEGRKQIVLTIIEENEHLKSRLKDMTRQFQNHLFSLFLKEKEERFGIFL